MEKQVTRNVGSRTSLGVALCMASRMLMTDEGKICNEVAFNTNSIADAYSAFSVLSKRCAARTPYGVAAPDIPKRLTEKFMQTFCKAILSSVFKSFFTSGCNSADMPRVTPLSSHRCINPIQTAWEAMREKQSVALFPAPSKSVCRNPFGSTKSRQAAESIKIKPKRIFIA